MADRTCSVEGCERDVLARGWCSGHYARWRDGRDVAVPLRKFIPREGPCTVEGCDRKRQSSGLCSGHYWRLREKGDTGGPFTYKKRGVPCEVLGCSRLACGDGLCRMHYERRRKGNAVGAPHPVRRAAGEGCIQPSGYKTITVNGRVVLEHRHVMEQHLGRPLAPYENVHHRDGQRSRNDIANLELWVKPQPAGQRPDDLAAWVVEHYPELVEAALADRRQLRLAI